MKSGRILPGALYRRRGTYYVAGVGGVVVLTVCVCAFSLLAVAAPALAVFPGKNGRILAMHELSGGEEALVTETPHGGEAQVIAEQPFYDPDAVDDNFAGKSQLSPDGSKVVLVGDTESEKELKEETQKEDNGEGEVSGPGPGLYVVPAGGGAPERIDPNWRTGGCPQSVSWSPSGTEVVYARIPFHTAGAGKEAGCVPEEGEEIMVAGVGAGAGVKIATGRDPVWSSTGQIAFIAGEGIQIVGGAFIPMEEPRSVDWSPQGKRLVIMSHTTFTTKDSIWTVNADGTDRVLLATDEQLTPPASWSPDGQSILTNDFSHELDHVLIINANEPDNETEGCTYVGGMFGQGLSWGVGSGGSEFEICIKGSEPTAAEREEEYSQENQGAPHQAHCMVGGPVNCATGNQVEAQTDLTVGGRGLGLTWTRTYNSQAAATQHEAGATGYGWTASYSAHLTFSEDGDKLTVHQDNGSTIIFDKTEAGAYVASNKLAQAMLAAEGSGYVYTLPDQTKLYFNGSGVLTSEADCNGNTLTMSHDTEGRLESVSDAAGRKLTLAYNAEEQVESVTDPMGRTVKYTYEGGDLSSVTEPGESSLRWRFKYDASHELTSETDARGNTTTSEYYRSHRMASQTDALGRKRTWQYLGAELDRETRITEPNGSITLEQFSEDGQPVSVTHAAETPLAATTKYEYDSAGNLVSVTDPNEHKTTFGYNAAGDRTSEKNAAGDEKKWAYDSKHEIETETTPEGETTTIKRNSDGDPEVIERPAPDSTTQKTTYKYDSYGDVESMTNPLERTWKYEYDSYGDRKSETDPEGNKTVWGYNEDSQQTSITSPKGDVEGANASEYTTTIERDAQGRPVEVIEPQPSEGRGGSAEMAPTDAAPPAISGTEQEGQTLGATVGTWEGASPLSYGYQWLSCDSLGASCLDIPGATSATYVLSAVDVGTTLRVAVTTSNAAGSETSTSEATGMIATGSSSGAVYSSQFGSEGSGNGQFNRPGDVALDPEGDLWVVDQNNDRVEEFSEAGEYLSQFGSEGSGNGQLKEPDGVAIGPNGDVWVLDTGNHRAEEFNKEGEYLRTAGSVGSGSGEFGSPEGIAVDNHNNIWVSNTSQGDVEEFNGDGEYVRTIGSEGTGPGQFGEPEGLAFDSTGDLFIADWRNDRIEEFSKEGEYIRQFGTEGTGDGQFENPYGIAVGPHDDVWVVDLSDERVEKFNAEGTYLGQFGSEGSGPGEFALGYPVGLAINAQGMIWITDTNNNRVDAWTDAVTLSNVSLPSIFGEAVSGQTLTATVGAWTGDPPPTYTFQWQVCNSAGGECEDILGATSSSYTVDGGDIGKKIKVLVTATSEMSTMTVGSAASSSIALITAPSNTSLPHVNGRPDVGRELGASGGVWTGAPSPGYTYQWQRCNEAGGECKDISGATGSSYVVAGGDVGAELRIVVTATNSAGSVSSESDTTGVVGFAHITKYAYDAAGNLKSVTDAEGHKTTYEYDADNEPIRVEAPTGAVTETEYDAGGKVISQTDANKHTTSYKRNELGEVTEITDPLGRKTIKEYDAAGSLKSLTSSEGQTATYTYYEDNLLKKVSYSGESTHDVEYEYDRDGNRTSMKDGTGTTSYGYDQLDRLIKSKDGHGEVLEYQYNLDDEATELTYPNADTVKRTYDKDGRLEGVEDWLGNITTFSYDPNSEQIATVFPSSTGEEDRYTYNDDGRITAAAFDRGSEALASIAVIRNSDGQLASAKSEGLPGESTIHDSYDENGRLDEAGSTGYEYDAANNPTKIGATSYTYDHADQLETSTGMTYAYNEEGERIKLRPTSGPETTYGYDQAGDLTSVTRPEEGSTPKIEDSYAYNGDGMRTSETIGGSTKQLVWDESSGLPLLLNDGSNSYIYGPGGIPIEQISTGGTTLYLHHDQQGSTRLLTGSTGKVEGSYTYTPYGAVQEHTGTATTPLGYDGQYTSADTGLIYLRARVYDPSTAQFLTVDPDVGTTRAPYTYANDNPLNEGDLSGRESLLGEIGNFLEPLNPVKYYEQEIESYENGCGYFASVAHGLEGAVIGVLDASGAGEEGLAAEGGDTAIEDTLAGLETGNNPGVYTVDSPEELQRIYDGLSAGGKPVSSSYPGEEVELSNGTRVGIRETSKTGGPTVDINTGTARYRIHVSE